MSKKHLSQKVESSRRLGLTFETATAHTIFGWYNINRNKTNLPTGMMRSGDWQNNAPG